MGNNIRKALFQLDYCGYELALIVNGKWWRWLTSWFGGSAGVVVSYRLDRFFYNLFGNSWGFIRMFFFPLFLFFRLISVPHEINYGADIGKGLQILHPSLGIVISKYAIIGEQLTLTGGNCIGGRKSLRYGDLLLGKNVTMGANAVILGPLRLGDNTIIGAGAVVIHSSPGGEILIGVPAQLMIISKSDF
jgi:serine O-acetyltransferase